MEKVHVILAVLKKQLFWVLCTLILILSTFAWMTAVGNIESEAKQNQQRIVSAKQDAQQVANSNQHPNDQITAAYNQQTEKLRQLVYQVWNSVYNRQRDTVLKWPAALGEDFIKYVDSTPFMGEIPVDFRDIYQNYVKTRWAELPAIIKARKVTEEDNVRGRGIVTPTKRGAPDYIVIWQDQEKIRKELFSSPRPTSEWVWLTQEDLWVYENLLNVIKKTNTGAIGPHNAVISTIENMDVGKAAAAGAAGKGQRISGTGAADADSGSSSGNAPSGLLNGRYVDAAGIPLNDGKTAGNEEYKRIPVRLVLKMDAREVPVLILNCANAGLPVEIQQVHINVDQTAGGTGTTVNLKSPDLSPEDRAAGRKTPHVEVTLQGLIYIFNPPNREKLKLPPQEKTLESATEAFKTEGDSGTVTPKFDDEPAKEGVPMATVPETEAAPAEGTATPATPVPTDPAGTPPAATGTTPPATTTPAPADPSKTDSLENLFEEEKPAAAPAKP